MLLEWLVGFFVFCWMKENYYGCGGGIVNGEVDVEVLLLCFELLVFF